MSGPIFKATRTGLSGVRAVWRAGLSFFYPPVCVVCGRDREETEEAHDGPGFCADCRAALTPDRGNLCGRCGAPVGPHLDASRGCARCRSGRFAFERVIRLGVYGGLLQSVCLRSKQPGNEPLAAAAAGLLWETAQDDLRRLAVEVVMPVPQHWTRKYWRGHNPAETIARVLARRLQVEFCGHILSKVRRTPDQARLPPTGRRANLRRAFRVRRAGLLSGASILLVDDVLTTGTTAHEISKVLRRAGAGRVVVAVLARGIGR